MRKLIIAGNWKMNKTLREAIELVNGLKRACADIVDVDIVICPPFISLADSVEMTQDTGIGVGAQNVYWEASGAFTGEVSPGMLKDLGLDYCIVGHSERRAYFGEIDETINKKIKALLEQGITPIFCLGETLEQRESNTTFDIIRAQLNGGLADISAGDMERIIVAYEPVWAIGTGKTATPLQAQEAHKFIRDELAKKYSDQVAAVVRIQYGGSVKPDNAKDLMGQPDIDGALVGGASLKVESFLGIIENSAL